MVISDIEEQRCTYHPNVSTRLRCSKCSTPICPRCAVETPVGYRCPECASVRGLPTYSAGSAVLMKSAAIGLIVATAVGVLWGFFPDWSFYLSLALGFGVAESIAWSANYKRGSELQMIGIVSVIVGLVVARIVIAERSPFISINDLLNNATNPAVARVFQVELIPDWLFAAIAMVIPYIRFK